MAAAQLSMSNLPEPILVVGAYGYRNVGDEAILAGLLRDAGSQRRLTVVSRAPAETSALHGVPTVGIAQAVPALARHRSVLIGGGGLFGRDIGRLGQLLAPFGLLAAMSGRRVAVHGVGVDPGLPRPSVQAIRALAARASSFTVRDSASADLLRHWGIRAGLTADLSERMEPASRRETRSLLRAAGVDLARPIVGLALTGLDTDATRNLPSALALLADALPEVQLVFIPMSQHPYLAAHNDLLLARRLRSAVPQMTILEGTFHPGLILAAFSLLSAAVCMRYHSLLFAARSGVPIIPIPYAPKCLTWIEEHGLAPAPVDGQALVRRVTDAMDRQLARTA
jgi:polysaccharide pyruvyl transferase WcaK-like protein